MDRARGPVGGSGSVAVRLRATAPGELEAISGLIHDAHFDYDEVAFDEGQRTLTIPFHQEVQSWSRGRGEPPWESVRSTRWYQEYRVPFYRGRLTVHHVTAFEGVADSGAPPELVGIRYDGARGRVTIDDWGEIHVGVERLEVTAELTDEATLTMRRRWYPLLNLERDVPW